MQLTRTATSSLIPAIRPWGDGFVLVWNEFAPGRLGPHDPDGRSEVMFTVVRPALRSAGAGRRSERDAK
jgi:hypothetical protein